TFPIATKRGCASVFHDSTRWLADHSAPRATRLSKLHWPTTQYTYRLLQLRRGGERLVHLREGNCNAGWQADHSGCRCNVVRIQRSDGGWSKSGARYLYALWPREWGRRRRRPQFRFIRKRSQRHVLRRLWLALIVAHVPAERHAFASIWYRLEPRLGYLPGWQHVSVYIHGPGWTRRESHSLQPHFARLELD